MNTKKQKEKFLEDYLSICIEHGCCIDFTCPDYLQNENMQLIITDIPRYAPTLGDPWDQIKKELRKSLND